MLIKGIGAICVILGCGAIGFQIAANYIKEERALRQLISVLDFMTCELQYRLTALPDLCRMCSAESKGCVSKVFHFLYEELTAQVSPDVGSCMTAALVKVKDLPPTTAEMLNLLGSTLGRFDFSGQVRLLESVRIQSRERLEQILVHKDVRVRSYKTLGLCAGAAMAILFI